MVLIDAEETDAFTENQRSSSHRWILRASAVETSDQASLGQRLKKPPAFSHPCLLHYPATNGDRHLVCAQCLGREHAATGTVVPHTVCSPSKATGTLCVKRPVIAACDPPFRALESAISGDQSPEAILPLAAHTKAWEAIPGASEWVLSTVKQGYTLQFARRPPRFQARTETRVNGEVAHLLRAEIATLLCKGAIEPVSPSMSESGFYSRYFLVPKKDGALRPFFGSETFEQGSYEKTVQNAHNQANSRANSPEGLVYISRSKRCVLSDPDNTPSQAILEIRLRRSGISVHRPAFRPVAGTPYIYEVHGHGCRSPEGSGNANSELLGRLANSSTVRGRTHHPQNSASKPPGQPGAHSQLDQELIGAQSINLFSGFGFGHCGNDGPPVDTARALHSIPGRVLPAGQHRTSQDISEDAGLYGFSCSSASAGFVKYAPATTLAECQSDSELRFSTEALVGPPRPPSVPIWDLSLVLEALKAFPFEPLESVDLKYLSLKTVFLIALSSVKRVGDLHVLSVSPACLEFGPNDSKVILRPRHGYIPKAIGTPFRAQIISLSALPASDNGDSDNLLCPVRALRVYITRSAAFRLSEQLFVSFGRRTKGLAASKQSLSRWIVDAIAAAYASKHPQCPLGIRAHSTRGMASCGPDLMEVKKESKELSEVKEESEELSEVKEESEELSEVKEECEELSEVKEEHHVKPGEKPLSRSKTKQTFLNKRAKKSFTCTQCGKSLSGKESFERHMRIHTGEKPFTCDQCGWSFTCKQSLKNHMRVHTGEKPHVCHQCGKSFSNSSHLNGHMRIHTGVKPYTCDQCGKTFPKASDLKRHLTVHTKEKPHSCSVCGKSFSQLLYLHRHEKIHTGVREYMCFECEKTFTTADKLKRHQRIHTGEKPYKCSHCDKRFRQPGHLKKHERIHTGEKPHTCDQCGKSFTIDSHLKQHLKIHAVEKPNHRSLRSRASSGPTRTWEQVKVKYNNILQTATKKKAEQKKTGGGPAPPHYTPAEELALGLNMNRPILEGIPEGSSSLDLKPGTSNSNTLITGK
ncbi:unnamed protein product [Leuciscus chuanchicus]